MLTSTNNPDYESGGSDGSGYGYGYACPDGYGFESDAGDDSNDGAGFDFCAGFGSGDADDDSNDGAGNDRGTDVGDGHVHGSGYHCGSGCDCDEIDIVEELTSDKNQVWI